MLFHTNKLTFHKRIDTSNKFQVIITTNGMLASLIKKNFSVAIYSVYPK